MRIIHQTVSELSMAGMPEVPLPDDIDLSNLLPEEQPITLQIGKVGTTSKGKTAGKTRRYGQQFYESLVAEINAKRPEGGWGHLLDPAKRSAEYEPPALRWVGAMVAESGVVYGTCIPQTKDAQDYLRVAELTNAKVATSFLGETTFQVGEQYAEAVAVNLENIDLAHPPRAGVKDAISSVFVSEMEVEDVDPNTNGNTTTQDGGRNVAEMVAELAQANGQIQEYEARIAEMEQSSQQFTRVRELVAESADLWTRLEVNVTGYGDDMVAVIEDVIGKLQVLQAQAILRDADDLIAEMVVSEDLRPFVAQMVGLPSGEVSELTAEMAGSVLQSVPDIDGFKAKVEGVLAMPHVQKMAQALVSEMAGPSAVVSQKLREPEGKQLDTSPEAVDAARNEWGV